MPLPQQARWTVPFYAPEKPEEHAENVRSLDRSLNGIPIFPTYSWHVMFASNDGTASGTALTLNSGVHATPPMFDSNTGSTLAAKTFRKQFDWTDVLVTTSSSYFTTAAPPTVVETSFLINSTPYGVCRHVMNFITGARHMSASGSARFRGIPGVSVYPALKSGLYTVAPSYILITGTAPQTDSNDSWSWTLQEVVPEPSGSDA